MCFLHEYYEITISFYGNTKKPTLMVPHSRKCDVTHPVQVLVPHTRTICNPSKIAPNLSPIVTTNKP